MPFKQMSSFSQQGRLTDYFNSLNLRPVSTFRPMKFFLTLSLIFFSAFALTQNKYTISGKINQTDSGEELIGATIKTTVNGEVVGAVANVYGFYSLTLPEGTYELTYSFVGFAPYTETVVLDKDITKNVEMSESKVLNEVVVTSEASNKNITSTEMSVEKLEMTQIKKMPALMGEVDVIKAIQMLPGVQAVGEGGSGFYVRGGAVDQNLILIDEANVYNASHLMGFFSVFNPDAVKEVQLYKGGIPAEYGGRLSSVLDVRMKDGNLKKYTIDGGIGSISSRLTLGGPIVKEKGSFIVSGRRTYADLFLKLSPNEDLRDNKLFFYDFNAKANYKINDNNRVYLSGYFGRDVLEIGNALRMDWGNGTAAARWNHVFTNKLFLNTTVTFSNYDYMIGEPEGSQAYEWTSNIKDFYLKTDFSYYLNPNNTIKFGLLGSYHIINPGKAEGVDVSILDEFEVSPTNGLEYAAYVSNKQKIGKRITANYGLRFSVFQNIGPGTYYTYNDDHSVKDTVTYAKGEIYNTYYGLEPRAGVTFLVNEASSIKASYNRTFQYIQMASNSTSASPFDVWFPASPNVKPQIADQVALGYFQNFKRDMYQASVEVYYKQMQNTIDFKDHATLLLNPYLEGELRFGRAFAYGAEFLVKKTKGKFTGWLGYTLSRAEREIEGINNSKIYPAKYDKTHDLTLVVSYDITPQFTASANFVYATGSAVTMPIGRYEYMGMIIPIYSDRNAKRLPDYHRADVALAYRTKKTEKRKWQGEWVLSVYNVYNRANAFSINFKQDEVNPEETKAEMLYLFGIVPSITFNFNF